MKQTVIFLGVHDTGVIFGIDPSCAVKLRTNFCTLANNKDKVFPPMYLVAKEYAYTSEGGFSGVDKNGKVVTEQPGKYHILHIHILISPVVVRHKGRMFDFGQKHLNDLFVLDGIQSVSARDAILREIISNSLAHRDFSNGFIAKMVIERDRILVENGNRAHGIGALDISRS